MSPFDAGTLCEADRKSSQVKEHLVNILARPFPHSPSYLSPLLSLCADGFKG